MRRTTAPSPTVPLQPWPVEVRTAPIRRCVGLTSTAIFRRWAPGDSGPEGRCRLCAVCTAHDDACLILVDEYVPPEQAALFSAADLLARRGFDPEDFDPPV
jgi:hypothetical protein